MIPTKLKAMLTHPYLALALRLNPIHPDYHLRRAEAIVADGEGWTLERYADARESAERAVRLDRAMRRICLSQLLLVGHCELWQLPHGQNTKNILKRIRH